MSNNANFSNVFINGISLDEIAERDGFPFFVMRLKGHGNYCLFKSEEGVCRRYHPETGEVVGKDYFQKSEKSANFRNPIQNMHLIFGDRPCDTRHSTSRMKDLMYPRKRS